MKKAPRNSKNKSQAKDFKKGSGKRDFKKDGRKPNPQPQIAVPNLYGYHAVAAAYLNPARKVKALYLTEQSAKGFDDIIAQAKGLERPSPQIIDKRELDNVLPQGAVHQGVAIICSDLPEMGVQDLIIKAQSRERSLVLILDQVTDPHNVGAIIRSACAFGALGVVMQSKHAPDIAGTLAKTACGGTEHVDVAYETNLSRSIEALKDGGFIVYGLDERGETEIQNADFSDKSVLVLGAEGPGIRRLVKENCDQLLRIPMTNAIASINVSNAAATSLYAWSIAVK